MANEYVALRSFRFGEGYLNPGDPVPHEPGRNYAHMLEIGEIAPKDGVTIIPTAPFSVSVQNGEQTKTLVGDEITAELQALLETNAELFAEVERLKALVLEKGSPLPEGFPAKADLEAAGYKVLELIPRDSATLTAIPKVGEKTAAKILEALQG